MQPGQVTRLRPRGMGEFYDPAAYPFFDNQLSFFNFPEIPYTPQNPKSKIIILGNT